MRKKLVLLGLLCIPLVNFAQVFNIAGWPNDKYGVTNNAQGANIKAVGIGAFTTFPKAALHVNTTLLTPPTNQAATFYPGEVFRTTSNATGTNVNAWRMFTGTGEGNEKFALYTNSGTSINPNDVYLQASKLGSNILFNTGGSFTRMIITDGKVTAPNMQTGLVGIGNNFLNPKSQLHINDGVFDTYLQITNNSTNTTPLNPLVSDGFCIGVLGSNGPFGTPATAGTVLINQQENQPIWFNAGGNPRMQILSSLPYVGIGNYNNFVPRNMLHIHDGNKPAYVQFTNNATSEGQPTGTEGFLVGINNTGEAYLNHQQAFAINFKTDNLQRAIINKDGYMGIGNYTSASPLTFPLHVQGDGTSFLSTYGWRRAIRIEDKGALVWDAGAQTHLVWNDNTQTYINLPVNHFFMAGPAGTGHEGDFFAGLIPTLNASDYPDYVYRIFGVSRINMPAQGTFQFYQHNVLVEKSLGIGSSHLFPQRNLDVFNSSLPQLRLSQTVSNLPSITPANGVYTDFTTTSAADLLIEPFSSGTSGKVGINISSLDPQPTTELDVDGNGRFRTLPVTPSTSTTVVVVDPDGTLGYNDNLVLGGGGGDYDWEHLTSGLNAGVYSGHSNTGGFNQNHIYVGATPTYILANPQFQVAKFASYVNPTSTEVVAAGFRNESNAATNKIGLFCDAIGLGGLNNFGGRFDANNAQTNYAGYFSTIGPVPNNNATNYAIYANSSGARYNYGVYSVCTDGYAGYFDGNVEIIGIGTITGGVWGPSDSILKTNIESISNARNVISQLKSRSFLFNTVQYPYLNLPEGLQYGLIAEDVQTVLPNLVKDIFYPGQKDSLGNVIIPELTYKGLNYTALIPIAIKGIQELDSTLGSYTKPPLPPVLISPANGATDLQRTIVFNWHSSKKAVSYKIYFSTSPDLSGTFKYYTITDTTIEKTKDFAPDSTYYWAVSAINGNGISEPSEFWSFTLTSPLLSPALISPVNDAVNIPVQELVFSWHPSAGALNYTLFISGPPRENISPITITDTFVTINNILSYLTSYNWYVVANSEFGFNGISETWSFTTGQLPVPVTPVLTSPVNGAINVDINSIKLSWQPSANAINYTVYISEIANDPNAKFLNTIKDNYVIFDVAKYQTTYYWYVIACNSFGCSEKSEEWSFTTVAGFVNPPPEISDATLKINITPVTGSLNKLQQLNGVYFDWDTIQNPNIDFEPGRQIGLIAQDVQPVIPEIVEVDKLGYHYINYNRVVPVLIEAVKELNTKNTMLTTVADSLKNIIANYETRFANIEAILSNCCQNQEGKLMQGNSSDNSSIVGHQSSVVGHQSLEYDNTEISSVIHITPDNSINSTVTELYQNRPNPFTTKTTFTYQLGKTGFVELEIHSELGAFVAKLVDMNQQEGSFSIDWNTNDIAPGIYFYSLKVDGQLWVKKAVRIK